MTEENQPEEEKFDPATDNRDWSAAATELACFALARIPRWFMMTVSPAKSASSDSLPIGNFRKKAIATFKPLQMLIASLTCMLPIGNLKFQLP